VHWLQARTGAWPNHSVRPNESKSWLLMQTSPYLSIFVLKAWSSSVAMVTCRAEGAGGCNWL